MSWTYAEIAKLIDHALLTPALKEEQLDAGCRLALDYDVASVCILPYAVTRCANILRGGTVRVSTVIGFPHGGQHASVKLAEARQALADGCEELDVVINISQAVSERWNYLTAELAPIIQTTHDAGQKVKVIFENCYLTDAHKRELCKICSDLGADWVKTSTGFGSGGATLDDLRLMRAYAAPHVQIKAAGGLRDLDMVLAARELGATRCGTSRTAEILDECRKRLNLTPLAATTSAPAGGY
ncbi:MAG: deoxyribose-phosphate aldolase [Pirellulales bacterium]|nr:deoxyribose-phosphate aldolase [Pirellulales bacterium]